ncbi:uncharacterized protein LOC143219391 [Lasioglossum baleicum]|uniref:uncharacterized protein LOC143219391 n=1 Tax=Lasioglossum baleicum TaxID=434251 RepID=UPI003FCDA7AD
MSISWARKVPRLEDTGSSRLATQSPSGHVPVMPESRTRGRFPSGTGPPTLTDRGRTVLAVASAAHALHTNVLLLCPCECLLDWTRATQQAYLYHVRVTTEQVEQTERRRRVPSIFTNFHVAEVSKA